LEKYGGNTVGILWEYCGNTVGVSDYNQSTPPSLSTPGTLEFSVETTLNVAETMKNLAYFGRKRLKNTSKSPEFAPI